jgi:hypothetical protein
MAGFRTPNSLVVTESSVFGTTICGEKSANRKSAKRYRHFENGKKSIGHLVKRVMLIIAGLYFWDPVFHKTVKFADQTASYEWRLFNNSFCNRQTAGHCFDNETNKLNAEIQLYQTALENYKGQPEIRAEIKNAVKASDRFSHIYFEQTTSKEIIFDSIFKYKDAIFKTIELK